MDILSRNLQALKKSQPFIYNELIDTETYSESFKFNTVNDIEVLYYKNSKGYLLQQTSMFNPVQYARDYLRKLDYEFNSSFFLQIGISGGYILEELLGQINKKSKVLCVERDISLLKEILNRRDLSQYINNKKLFFIIESTDDVTIEEQVKQLVFILFKYMIGNLQTIIHPIYDYEYISYSRKIINMVNSQKELLSFKLGNDIDDTLVGLDNNLTNMYSLITNPGINELLKSYKDTYKDKPAIIVASGPSLNKNIHELQKAVGKALIFSCDGSFKALNNRGIKVDGIGSVERIRKTYEAFYDGETFPEDTVLIAPIVIQNDIIKKFGTKKLLFTKRGLPPSMWLEDVVNKGAISCGPSVSHMLFGVAKKLGCNPIILIGQDLAYSEEGISHVKEAEAVIQKVKLDKVETYVKDYNGNDIASTYIWEKFLKTYEEIIEECKETIIDASEGGAYIKGTQVTTLKKAIEKYCNEEIVPLRGIIDSIEVDAKYIDESTLLLYESIQKQLKSFNLLRSQAHKGLKWINISLRVLEKGLETPRELDDIYDCIDYTGETLLKKISKNHLKQCIFQYPIYAAIHQISLVKSNKFTIESIKENLLILKQLLTIIELYSRKSLKIFYKHYKQIPLENFQLKTLKEMRYIEKYITSSELDIPESVIYGYNLEKGRNGK